MKRTYLLVLSRAKSEADEPELNRWYNEVHIPEVMALPGFNGVRRFKATAIQPTSVYKPTGEAPALNYMALYELEDAQTALDSLASNGPNFTKTTTSDSAAAMRVVFEEVFSAAKGD